MMVMMIIAVMVYIMLMIMLMVTLRMTFLRRYNRQYFETATASLKKSLMSIQNSQVLTLVPIRQKYSSTL